jgi:outer membrane protein assembly factor BamB
MKFYRIANVFLCLTLIIGVTACGSNKKKELKPVELESFKKEIKIDKLWSKKIGAGLGDYYHQFVMSIDSAYIYAASENGKVYKFDKLTGKKQWKVSIDADLTVGASVDEKHVYVAAIDGAVIALDKLNGQQVWVKKLTSEIVSAPSVNGNHLIVQASNGQVFNLDTNDGEQRWRFDSSMPALTLRGNNRAQFFANYVVVGQANGKLAVLELETGQLLWEPKIADPKGDTEIERIVDVDATPVIISDKLFAVSYQGRIVAYDLKAGRLIWASDESSFRDIAASFGNVYVTNTDGIVTAYDEMSGTIKWANEDFLRRKLSAPAAVSSYLVVADFEGYVHVLSQVDGHVVARKLLYGTAVKSPILVDGTRFYVMGNNGRLKAYAIGKVIKK